jgi:hypothetical protein
MSHYCAVANTAFGLIPGKAKEGIMWYGWKGKERSTKDFDYVVESKGGPVARSIVAQPLHKSYDEVKPLGRTTDGEDFWCAIAYTRWGQILGRTNGKVCIFGFRSKEYETTHFTLFEGQTVTRTVLPN